VQTVAAHLITIISRHVYLQHKTDGKAFLWDYDRRDSIIHN